jgi:hypothetical protein
VYTKYSGRARELSTAETQASTSAENVGIIDPASQPDSEDEFYVSQNRTVSDSEEFKWAKQEVVPRDTDILLSADGRLTIHCAVRTILQISRTRADPAAPTNSYRVLNIAAD